MRHASWLAGCAIGLIAGSVQAQDWPQWRGPNRDAKVTGFKAPATWPKELKETWKVTVGDGVATPALVGDKLYVFSRQSGNEVIRCLNASDGKTVWEDKYEARPASGAAASFPGPRCSPTVAEGKLITLGVQGTLTCYDAESGKQLWRKTENKTLPRFFTSSSPIVVNGLCIAQVGGEREGGIVAFDLTSGEEKWRWSEDGTAYASPVLLTIGDAKLLVAETANNIVAIDISGGKLLWKTDFAVTGGRGYNASTPMVDGQTIIYSGSNRGTKAVKVTKEGDRLSAKELWKNKDNSVQFNTPIVHDGLVFGLTARGELFCINAEDGKTARTAPMPRAAGSAAGGAGGARPGGGGGGRPGGGRMMMGGGAGYGSIVDAGAVLFALTPAAQLVVFEPNAKEFKKIASYKVGERDTYAYPIVSGNRIFVKDKDSVILWSFE
jgi:outer membrane protein assembly factor BamB